MIRNTQGNQKLPTHRYKLINLKVLKIIQTINEHVYLTLTAILKEESEINHIRNTNAFVGIEVDIEDLKYKPNKIVNL